MCLLTFLILTSVLCTVNGFYIPYPRVIAKIDAKSLLNQDLEARNLTDSYRNITELAREDGYIIETHNVTTEDGYILGLHRLKSTNGIPVFLMHGLIDSSDSWILQGPNISLAYLLNGEGFDVWLGNARGNKYSASHTELNPNEEQFWTFSWEEIGVYDLPAMIDYILSTTDTQSLYYVGHSQGTTSFFVMGSLKPGYRRKIKTMFALSPIAWLSHAQSPILKYVSTIPATIFQYVQFYNTLTPSNDLLHQMYASMCKVISAGCGSIFEMVFGNNYFVTEAMLPVIVGHASTSSIKQFVHYWQLYQSGRFCRFDYGWVRNLFIYGQFSPPDYNVIDINVPVILFFSSNDGLSNPLDVFILQNHLPHVSGSYYSQYFSHIDYLYATVAKEAVYDKIVEHIRHYELQ